MIVVNAVPRISFGGLSVNVAPVPLTSVQTQVENLGRYGGGKYSGHMNIGRIRAMCAGQKGKNLKACMKRSFRAHGTKCNPKAKSCTSVRGRARHTY